MAEKKYPAEDHRKFHAWKWEERHAALYSALVGMFVVVEGCNAANAAMRRHARL